MVTDTERALCLLLSHTSQLFQAAGSDQAAWKLRTVPIRTDQKLACVFKALRHVEMAMTTRWSVTLLSPSPQAHALEAAALCKAAAVAALASPADPSWVRELDDHVCFRLRASGLTPVDDRSDEEG